MPPTTPSVPIPDDVFLYHQQMVEALRVLDRQFDVVILDRQSPFHAAGRRSFDATLEQMRLELDQQAVFMLIASAEALLRQDLRHRTDGSSTSPIAVRLRMLRAQHPDPEDLWRISLESIIDEWKTTAGASHEGGLLKQLYQRRHWLGHGRYWPDKSGVQPTPRDAYRRIKAFEAALRAAERDFPC